MVSIKKVFAAIVYLDVQMLFVDEDSFASALYDLREPKASLVLFGKNQ